MMPPALPVLLLALSSALLIRAAPPVPAAPRGQTLARCPAPTGPPATLGDAARRGLEQSLEAAREHARHLWRDTPPLNQDRTVNVFVEIAPGSREKWEFDMEGNRRKLNRIIPEALGGYPVGYGFVPGTIGLDGDPFDGLVLGEAEAATVVRGHVLGIMHMTDEKGPDSKVVVTAEPDAATRRGMLEREKPRIAEFFNRYKAEDDDEESYACVSGWGDADEARQYVAAAASHVARARR